MRQGQSEGPLWLFAFVSWLIPASDFTSLCVDGGGVVL